jgi:DNA-directed RNA polymerase sigma subunit (sigma70/sigma32)
MGYRGYGLPVGELISEGNVGMMQAVRRFDPDRGFRLATYAMWWIKRGNPRVHPALWSLVKMGTTAAQKKLFFNLRRLKGQMAALEEGDLKPEQVAKIAHTLQVPEQDVVSMNRRLASPDNIAERAGACRQRGRVAGLAGGREREPGNRDRRAAGHVQPPDDVGRGAEDAERA